MTKFIAAAFFIAMCAACQPVSAPSTPAPTPTERAPAPVVASPTSPLAPPLTEEGKRDGVAPSADAQRLVQALDAMQVETHWLKGVGVDWQTGEPNNRKVPLDDTHCSAFAAAVSVKLGMYLLRPPEHATKLLANAQNEWLNAQGAQNGWERVTDGVRAQELANLGYFVVASYKNPNPQKSGHIAVVRPSAKSVEAIRAEGPQITQAGSHNYNSAPLNLGFAGHPLAISKKQIQFFAHALNAP